MGSRDDPGQFGTTPMVLWGKTSLVLISRDKSESEEIIVCLLARGCDVSRVQMCFRHQLSHACYNVGYFCGLRNSACDRGFSIFSTGDFVPFAFAFFVKCPS